MALKDPSQLKRPAHPNAAGDPTRPQSTPEAEQPDTSGPSDGESKAMAKSTAVAHSMRLRLNEDVSHIAGLQKSWVEGAKPVAENASDFIAGAITGELLWGAIAEMTEQKVAAAPKAERVTFDVAPALSLLEPPAWRLPGETHNRYLPSATGSFGDYTNPYDDTAA